MRARSAGICWNLGLVDHPSTIAAALSVANEEHSCSDRAFPASSVSPLPGRLRYDGRSPSDPAPHRRWPRRRASDVHVRGFLVIDDLKKGYYLLFIDGGTRANEQGQAEGAIGVILQNPILGRCWPQSPRKWDPWTAPTKPSTTL